MRGHFNSLDDYTFYLARAKQQFMREFDLAPQQVIAWIQTHRQNGERNTYHLDYSRLLQQEPHALAV